MLITNLKQFNNTLTGKMFFGNNKNNFNNYITKTITQKYFEVFKLGDEYIGTFLFETKFENENNKPNYFKGYLTINATKCDNVKLIEEFYLAVGKNHVTNINYSLGWNSKFSGYTPASVNKLPYSLLNLIVNKSDDDIVTHCINN
jgi:hypothetical protein